MKEITPQISIVIPVYNEEDNVDILYKEIQNSVDQLNKPYEIIFVDDGSYDSTFECLINIKKKERCKKESLARIRIIRFSRNFGQTPAMQAGFDHARGDIIISLDGDLQNNPSDIPKLLSKLHEGYDVVCGWRRDRKDKTMSRIIPSKVANWLIGKITGIHIHDSGCSLKAYRSSVFKSVNLYSDMHRFVPAMSTIAGARVTEIAVNHRPRKYGKTKYGLSRTWKVLLWSWARDGIGPVLPARCTVNCLSCCKFPFFLSLWKSFIVGPLSRILYQNRKKIALTAMP